MQRHDGERLYPWAAKHADGAEKELGMSETTTRRPPAMGWVLVLTAAAALVVALDQLVVATAIQTIRTDLHASMASLEWTVSAFSLSFAALIIPGAEVGDRFGRKRTYLVGLVVFAAASAACALAPSIGLLITARVVQGAGAALISPAALALLTAATPPSRRGAVMGVYAAVMGLAVVGGPLVGGAVTQGLAWQWIFWINLPVIALVAPLAAVKLTEVRGGRSMRLDVLGLLLVTAGMFGLTWGLLRSGPAGWGSAEVLGALIGGAVVLVGFVAWELRTSHPMLPMRLFARRGFTAGNASTMLLTASLFSTVFFLAQYLQVSLGYGPVAAGARYLPWTLPIFVIAPMAGALQDRIGPRALISTGLALQGAGLLWLATNAHADRGYGASALALVVSGVGTSMAMPAQQTAVMAAVAPADLGKAAGTFNTVRQLGGVLGIAVVAAVFAASGDVESPRAFADGFAAAMVAAGVIALLGSVVGVFSGGRAAVPAVAPTAQQPAVMEASGAR